MSKRIPRTNAAYLRDILDATTKLKELIQGMDYESFQEDWRTYHAAFSLLEIIWGSQRPYYSRVPGSKSHHSLGQHEGDAQCPHSWLC